MYVNTLYKCDCTREHDWHEHPICTCECEIYIIEITGFEDSTYTREWRTSMDWTQDDVKLGWDVCGDDRESWSTHGRRECLWRYKQQVAYISIKQSQFIIHVHVWKSKERKKNKRRNTTTQYCKHTHVASQFSVHKDAKEIPPQQHWNRARIKRNASFLFTSVTHSYIYSPIFHVERDPLLDLAHRILKSNANIRICK